MGKKSKTPKYRWASVRHEQIYLKTRGHNVDIHVYPVMQRLWDAGVQTFFSCQGGPHKLYNGNMLKSVRAYVIVLKKDEELAMMVLKDLNPKPQKWESRYRRDQLSIKFDASPEANAVRVTVEGK